jgi:hypothetical protein
MVCGAGFEARHVRAASERILGRMMAIALSVARET